MASYYPVRREGPLTREAVAASLRAGHARQEKLEQRLNAPLTPSQQLHKQLIAKENRTGDVLRLAAEAGAELGSNNVATAIHKVAQLSRRDHVDSGGIRGDIRFRALEAQGLDCASDWSSRQLCHVAWSLAALSAVGGGPLLAAVATAFPSRGLAEGVPQDISTFAWALAVIGWQDPGTLQATADEALLKVHEFGMQDLSIAAWAFAKLLFPGRRPLLAAIATESLGKLGSFTGRNLANLSWAFATAQQRDLDLCEALVQECSSRITELGPQELPIALWSFAASGYPSDAVFNAATEQVVQSLDGMDVPHVCNVLWAYARAGPRHESLFMAMAEEAARRLPSMEPLHISNVAWAFASAARADEFDLRRVGVRHEPLFRGIAVAAARRAPHLSAQHCASLMWAFAVCAVPDADGVLADAVHASLAAGAGPGTAASCEPRHAAGILWALATLLQRHEPLCTHLIAGVTRGGVDDLARDGPAHLAAIAWAATRLGFGASHRGLRTALRSNVDGLLAALAGSLPELSDGRRQNIAAVVRALYDSGLAETARALLIRTQDAEVAPGVEAWAAWIAGADAVGDADLEGLAWLGLAAATPSLGGVEPSPHNSPWRATTLNAAAARALAVQRPDLAAHALAQLGDAADAVSGMLWQRLGRKSGRTSYCTPRGDYSQELRTARRLVSRAPEGDAAALVAQAEAAAREDTLMAETLGFACEARGAILDAAIRATFGENAANGHPRLILELGCGIGAAAVRAAQLISGSEPDSAAPTVYACDAEAMRAAAAMNVVEWAGANRAVAVWVGRNEQLLARLRRERGPGCVAVMLLNCQGGEYREDLELAEALGLLAPYATVVADRVLQPMAPEFMWRVCAQGPYRSVAVSVGGDWVLVARRCRNSRPEQDDAAGEAEGRAAALAMDAAPKGAIVLPTIRLWPAAPAPVRQLCHRADEARRRTPAWRRRDRLVVPTWAAARRDAEAEEAAEVYSSFGVAPPVVCPYQANGRWVVDLAVALGG